MWLGNEGLRRAELRPGMRFLDVAAGSGALSIPAARLGAQVLATDQSPVMLDLLEERARKEGLDIETRVMDGHALELDDDSFDMAGSQFGVMLFPDMPKGIREMARVVEAGRPCADDRLRRSAQDRVLRLSSWAPSSPSARTSLARRWILLRCRSSCRIRSGCDEELAAAGLKDIKVETITETTEFQTGKDLWDWLIWSNPIVEMVLEELNLTTTREDRIQQALEKLVRERAGGSGAAIADQPDQHRHRHEVTRLATAKGAFASGKPNTGLLGWYRLSSDTDLGLRQGQWRPCRKVRKG